MHITVTSVYAPGLDKKLHPFCNALEKWLNSSLSNEDFGPVRRFMFVIVAVFDDVEKNNFFRKKHDKIGSYALPGSKDRTKYFSIAVPFSPQEVDRLDAKVLGDRLCQEIIFSLENPQVKISKSIDYESFSDKVKMLVSNFKDEAYR